MMLELMPVKFMVIVYGLIRPVTLILGGVYASRLRRPLPMRRSKDIRRRPAGAEGARM